MTTSLTIDFYRKKEIFLVDARFLKDPRCSYIKIASKDQELKTFTYSWATFYWSVMSFILKSVGATYQRLTTIIFHHITLWKTMLMTH